MSTIDIILLVVFSAALLFFVYSLFTAIIKNGSKSPKTPQTLKPEGTPAPSPSLSPANEKELNIRIRKESDGVHFILPPSSATVQDASEDLFPQIINDMPPEDKGLTYEYFLKLASMPHIEDPEERERIIRPLAEKGIIRESDVSSLAILDPGAVDNGEKPVPENPQPESNEDQIQSPETIEPVPEPMPEEEPIPAPAEDEDAFINHEFNY